VSSKPSFGVKVEIMETDVDANNDIKLMVVDAKILGVQSSAAILVMNCLIRMQGKLPPICLQLI
jgi:hypothetical protein